MSFDYREFVKLRDKFDKAAKEFDTFLYDFLLEQGLRALTLTKENTPVDTGLLRNTWQLGPVKRSGSVLYIELYNLTEYASFVEDGHRQTPGRYVPAIGKRLKADYVAGKHMARLAIAQIEKEMPVRFEAKFKNWLKSLEEI